MNNYHEMHLSDLDFGDNLKMIVCHQCGRSMSIGIDDNGILMWNTRKVVNQGDFHALHQFFKIGTPGISMSLQASPEQ